MPIALTSPLDMGAIDVDYTHVKIQHFAHDAERGAIELTALHGTLNGSEFVPGKGVSGVTHRKFEVVGADYLALVTKLPTNTTEPLYAHVAKELYQWLIDKGHYAGTIV